MENKTPKECMETIYEEIADKTISRLKKEKANKVSKKTLKMIALTRELYYDVRS